MVVENYCGPQSQAVATLTEQLRRSWRLSMPRDMTRPIMSTKIIFLDIDGPMIPATMILVDRMASERRLFPPTTIAVLNRLCSATGAKIVLNTSHSESAAPVPTIEEALVSHGFKTDYFHLSDRKTEYPRMPRHEAVKDWLGRHPEVTDWIALDDSRFTDEPNLIWIDPDAGLHLGNLNEALKRLGAKPCVILM
jgi:hypothetical protein